MRYPAGISQSKERVVNSLSTIYVPEVHFQNRRDQAISNSSLIKLCNHGMIFLPDNFSIPLSSAQ